MFNQHNENPESNLGQLIPGYGYYDRLGDRLAESLLNLVETIISLLSSSRR